MTAYLVFILITLHYVIDYVPTDDMNNVDWKILGWIWKTMPQHARPSDKWGPGLRKLVLTFSDTQLVTGIAILAGAFSQLRCGIQVYSWQIIVYLAWFSSCTHMSTLTVLRAYFREHRVLRISRLIGMLITVVMLIVALMPTASPNWEYLQSLGFSTVPALCHYKWITSGPFTFGLFDSEDDPYLVFNGTISICYLGISYSIRALKLSKTGSKWVRDWLRTKPSEVIQNCLRQLNGLRDGKFRLVWMLAYEALLICFVYCRAIADLFESMFWEVSFRNPSFSTSLDTQTLAGSSR